MPSNDERSSATRIAILWHMHQPNYQEPGTNRLAMPWVRLHATKDYLDMPLLAARYPGVRVTFNLVPSLLDQLELYLNGGTDRHLELSRLNPSEAGPEVRQEIIETFFLGNPATMIEPYPAYHALYRKARANGAPIAEVARLFSSSEIRDLQVWSNLVWVDPLFRDEPPVRALFTRQRHFTEAEKQTLLDWQLDLIRRIIPTYRELLQEGRIDISFTPYYHPILPLLCDTNVALEAIPSLQLPRQPFRHPEDAEAQIRMARERYRELFDREMIGMWPSEGSVSEEVADIAASQGLRWLATDEDILRQSLVKSRLPETQYSPHDVYLYPSGVRLLFRDHGLSDRIGFVYAGWPADRAVADFIMHLKAVHSRGRESHRPVVVPIMLDGENAWEYFHEDGMPFLEGLYQALDADPELQCVTCSEAAEIADPLPLPRLFAGSWINHNFRIWIGHPEDNLAWELLARTREALVSFVRDHPDYPADRLEQAWRQIYIAEGSDWCWWYGDEHRGAFNAQFDRIFRRHLAAVYELLELDVPPELHRPIHEGGALSYTLPPVDLLTAQIDGRVTHFYEWSGAGFFDCLKAGGAMHRVDHHLAGIYFAYDHNRVYIRLDFANRAAIDLMAKPRIVITVTTPAPLVVEIPDLKSAPVGEEPERYQYAVGEMVEVAIERRCLWPSEYGELQFSVTLYDGEALMESWPEGEPIALEVPERNKEMFWPV